MPTPPADPGFPQAFWRTLKRLDKSKMNSSAMSLRNSIAVALPLALAIELGSPLPGVAIATGALNVAYSDGHDPYAQRARRLLTWSVLGAVAVFCGSASGNYMVLTFLVVALWAFGAGMLVSISTRAGDLGINTLVTLIVYSARAAMSPKGALYAGLLVLAGGLLQTLLALLFWPIRPNQPERQVVGKVYRDLEMQVDPKTPEILATPLAPPSADVQDVLSALGRDHSVEGERFRLLFDQADRLRFSIYLLERLDRQLGEDFARTGRSTAFSKKIPGEVGDLLTATARLFGSVSNSLSSGKPIPNQDRLLKALKRALDHLHGLKSQHRDTIAAEIAAAADVVAGQVRLVVKLTNRSVEDDLPEFAGHLTPSWKLQVKGWLATLRANLYRDSPAFRHALRLAVCVAIGDAMGRSIGVQRNYWLPMTVAVVLKPDFTTTISRGVLRLGGTLVGLLLATLLFHVLPQSAVSQLLLVGVFTFFLRYAGGGNYGLFSVAISGLIVFLISQTGVAPRDVVVQRAINTAAGGVFALIAYAVWPTWEKTQIRETIASMIDSARLYFQAVMARFTADDSSTMTNLEDTRKDWRRARSAAEASIDRLSSEPRANQAQLDSLTSMLASSSGLVHSFMGLEAGVSRIAPKPLPPALETFANDVEFTLYYMSAALRGSPAAADTFPRIREDHRRLVDARNGDTAVDEYVIVETDALTVSLNTFREQVVQYLNL